MTPPHHFVCPSCRGPLLSAASAWQCRTCGRSFPIAGGLVRFAEVDSKYEEQEASRWDRGTSKWTLPFVDVGVTWFFSKYVPPETRVLDVGCGTGLQFIARHAKEVCGVDLAPARLRKAAEIYTEVSVGSLLELPYPNEYFDVVLSVDVIEHIPAEVKDRALREMLRVIRPGGRMVHVLDLDSRKPLYRWAESDPALFKKYFVDQMGHYGLETATAAIARFDALGMHRLAVEATNRTELQHPENYAWQFDNEYRHKSRAVRLLTSASYFIRRHPALKAAYSGFYQLLWTRTAEKLFPVDWSFNLAVAYEKT